MKQHRYRKLALYGLFLALAVFLMACRPTADDPIAAPSPTTLGYSRSNPLPPTNSIKLDNWEITIKRIVRSDDAWIMLREANRANQPPSIGKECLLINYHIRHTRQTGKDEHLSLRVTGSHNRLYAHYDTSLHEPRPLLDTYLEPNSESEGWQAYEIKADETDLILVLHEFFYPDQPPLYVALEEKTAVTRDPALDNLVKTETGSLLIEPALFGEQITTDDWQIELRQVVYGDDAWNMIIAANKFNDPPPTGMIYTAIKVWLRYIGTDEETRFANEFMFQIIDSNGNKYKPPTIVDPEPTLSTHLFAGGQTEGWIVMELPASETQPILIFDPLYEFGNDNKRFLALPGYGR